MEHKSDNRSLFLYTALIFVVALVMIILSFFGQSNLEKNQINKHKTNSIAEKAAALSDENLLLREQNMDMSEKLEKQEAAVNSLKTELNGLKAQTSTKDLLMSANGYFSVKNYGEAARVLAQIDETTLSADEKILYDQIYTGLQD